MLKNEECNESWNCSEGKQEMEWEKEILVSDKRWTGRLVSSLGLVILLLRLVISLGLDILHLRLVSVD